jgi:hypothetical protein
MHGSNLLGAIVLMLIALEGASKILTGKFRIFGFLIREAKKAGKWLWRRFWRMIRWIMRAAWRGIRRLFNQHPQNQQQGEHP